MSTSASFSTKQGFAHFVVLFLIGAVIALALYRGNFAQKPNMFGNVEANVDVQATPAPSAVQTVGSFVDSKGVNKYLIQVTFVDESLISRDYLYLSSDKDYAKGKKIVYAFGSRFVTRTSDNHGTKFIVVEIDGGKDKRDFAVFDESGIKIDLDLTSAFNAQDLTTAKIKFGQWEYYTSVNFSLVAIEPDGSQVEAVFDAESGKILKSPR